MAQKKQTQTSRKMSTQKIIVIVLLIAAAGFFIYNIFFKEDKPKMDYYNFTKEGELSFTDSLGTPKTKIDLELADNEYERELGLMKRVEMKENQGMLFIFPEEQIRSFWMRNTLISLDMIFINAEKQIVTIHKNTTKLSDQTYPSTKPAMYVVEVVAGFTDRHNIQVGDRIDWMETRLGL
jgi:uncharacterized membrane protein (UPF0127 family)